MAEISPALRSMTSSMGMWIFLKKYCTSTASSVTLTENLPMKDRTMIIAKTTATTGMAQSGITVLRTYLLNTMKTTVATRTPARMYVSWSGIIGRVSSNLGSISEDVTGDR